MYHVECLSYGIRMANVSHMDDKILPDDKIDSKLKKIYFVIMINYNFILHYKHQEVTFL